MVDEELLEAANEFLSGGPKRGTELVAELVAYLHTNIPQCKKFDIPDQIEIWVQEGEIVEVEYVLPSMTYRTKSLYFPKGTICSLAN